MLKFELKEIILLLAIGQGFFLAIVLFFLQRGRSVANRILAMLIFMLTFYLFTILVFWTGLIKSWPHFIMSGFAVLPLIPPLFYLYLRSLGGQTLTYRSLLHFIPFIFQSIYWAPFYFSDVQHKMAIITGQIEPPFYAKWVGAAFEYMQFTQHITYVVLIWAGVGLSNRSGTSILVRPWLTWIKIFFTFYAFSFVVGDLTYTLFNAGVPDYVYFYSIALFLYLVGYYGYYQQNVIFNFAITGKPKYSYSTLSTEDSNQYFSRLVQLMDGEKPYLNYDLKLRDMAERLEVSVHDLSRAVNENSGYNFSDFINQYRVKEARKILEDPNKSNQKMLAVAFDSGFGNKVSFYNSFKKFEGTSPLAYRGEALSKITDI